MHLQGTRGTIMAGEKEGKSAQRRTRFSLLVVMADIDIKGRK